MASESGSVLITLHGSVLLAPSLCYSLWVCTIVYYSLCYSLPLVATLYYPTLTERRRLPTGGRGFLGTKRARPKSTRWLRARARRMSRGERQGHGSSAAVEWMCLVELVCGLVHACLVAVFRAHGALPPLSVIRLRHRLSVDGRRLRLRALIIFPYGSTRAES